MSESTIYRPYSRLVRIKILDRWFEVPENNILLRCFQYIAPGVPYGPFCWNGDCDNDRLRFREAGGAKDQSALSCQTLVRDGMEIEWISPDLARVLAAALKAPQPPKEPDAAAAAPAATPEPAATVES